MKARRARALTTPERLLVLCSGVALSVACSFSTDNVVFDDEAFQAASNAGKSSGTGGANGGGAGKGSAGKSSSGSSSGGDSGEAGAETGGDAGEVGTGGTAGKGSSGGGGVINVAGNVGVAGMGGGSVAGGGGSGGAPPVTTYPCKGAKPGEKLLADFDKLQQPNYEWKDGNGTVFGVYAFPDPPAGKPNWMLGTGTLAIEDKSQSAPTGAGLKISPCLDLTGASAVYFNISGAYSIFAPTISLRIITNQNLAVDNSAREGMCVPKGKDPNLYCRPSHVEFVLSKDAQQLAFKFGEFGGGLPNVRPDLDQVKGFEWVITYLIGNKVQTVAMAVDNVIVTF